MTGVSRTARAVAISCGFVLTSGSPQRSAVWVESGSTVTHLIFGLGKDRAHPGSADIGVVRVYRCDGSSTGDGAMWVLESNGATKRVERIVYGDSPAGFVSDQGPRPLSPGCYLVDVSGSGQTQFEVGVNGAISERVLR
jgi:hypothetical protein